MQDLQGVVPTSQPLLEAMHSHLIRDEPRELGNVIVLTKCVAPTLLVRTVHGSTLLVMLLSAEFSSAGCNRGQQSAGS